MGLEEQGLRLLITFGLIPVVGFYAVKIIGMMVCAEIPGLHGTVALFGVIGLFAVTILRNDPITAVVVFIVLVTLGAFWPYASDYLDNVELRELDTDRLDSVHQTLASNPNNYAAWFEAARLLKQHCYDSQALAIGERTIAALPVTGADGLSRSLHDAFQAEISMVRQWRRDSKGNVDLPLVCPKCGHSNPPVELACQRCREPYLLLLARKGVGRKGATAKLLLGWTLISLALGVMIAVSIAAGGKAGMWPAIGFILVMGFVLSWLFRLSPRAKAGMG